MSYAQKDDWIEFFIHSCLLLKKNFIENEQKMPILDVFFERQQLMLTTQYFFQQSFQAFQKIWNKKLLKNNHKFNKIAAWIAIRSNYWHENLFFKIVRACTVPLQDDQKNGIFRFLRKFVKTVPIRRYNYHWITV